MTVYKVKSESASKSIRYNGVNLKVISKKEYNKRKRNLFLGYLYSEVGTEYDILDVSSEDKKFSIRSKKPRFTRVAYYVDTVSDMSEEVYSVGVCKVSLLYLILILFIVFCVWKGVLLNSSSGGSSDYIESPSGDFVDAESVNNQDIGEISNGSMLVPGYVNLYTTDDKSRGKDYILLNNPSGNKVTFQYIISEHSTGNIIHESSIIPSGKAEKWYPELPKGSYTIDFKIKTVRQNGDAGTTPVIPKITLNIY